MTDRFQIACNKWDKGNNPCKNMSEKEAYSVFDMYTDPKSGSVGATFTLFRNGREVASRTVVRPAKGSGK